MSFLKITLKILVILAVLLLMAMPFILEYFTFRRDKERKISYKRFRIVVYTVIYAVAVTVLLYFSKELLLWIESQSFVQWIIMKIGLSVRAGYFGALITVILINTGIGFAFRWVSKLVRIGLKKLDLVMPKKENGEYSRSQKLHRRVIKFFHNETWFFVSRIVKWLSIVLSVVYALVFAAYMTPALFAARWIPYGFINMLFNAGYVYPTITLLVLWQTYFFLEGIKRLEEECPELLYEGEANVKRPEVDLKVIDDEVRKQFGDFYTCDVDVTRISQNELSSTDHSSVTEYIAQAVENDKRNPQARKEAYLNCLDKIVEGDKGVLINGNFFSEFSMYFLRYVSAILARGDNVAFVCNNDAQIDAVYDYLNQGLSEISSLYCKGFRNDAVDFDDPIWRIVKVSGDHSVIEEAAVDENNVLVTSLSYLCSTRFESEHSRFISLIDAVVFVDSLNTVNTFNRQLAIINTRLKHIAKKNSLEAKNGKASDMFRVRYTSRSIRYFCFDDTRTPGLDKVLKNMLGVDFDTADSMKYSPSTIVRCYSYEGKVDENGRRRCPQFFNSEEEVGAVMNMAVLCLAKGASSVTVFADNILPYENIAETIAANMGQVAIKADGSNIRLNKQFYNPDNYSVIIAMDSGNNAPAALRRYLSMVSDKPALVIIFSRPYMLRDYYLSNVDELWSNSQIERIPVEEGSRKDVAQRILVKANAGGISKEEVLRLAAGVPQFAEFAANGDLDAILRGVLQVYGEECNDRISLFKFFEYTSSQDFDENGKYNSEVRIVLRRQGKLFDSINGRNMVVMIAGDLEVALPIPRSRLTQNYIAGQNLVYNGNIYYIQKIDAKAGRIYTRLAVGGKNDEAYQYVQAREYRLDVSRDNLEYSTTKHVVLDLKDEGISVNDVYISAFRSPMEVITDGYFEIDPHTLAANSGSTEYHSINDPGNNDLAKQTYRRYGNVASPAFSSDPMMKSAALNAYGKGAQALSLRICGEFGENIDKTMSLAAVMLNEIIHSMFPSVADSVVVCPVLHGEPDDDESKAVLKRHPKIKIIGESDLVTKTDFDLVIIEDSETDLGVVSVLMSAGDDVLRTLFNPVFNYLSWYMASENKSDYLYYGLDHEPSCFDFTALYKLSGLLGDDKHDVKFVDLDSVTEYVACDFCGKRFAKSDDVIELEDGRRMCRNCAENLVGNNKKVLKAHLERAKRFLESTYGITLDDDYEFCFESTVKIANTLKQNRELIKRGSDVPLRSYVDDNKKVHVEYSIPSVNLSELLVRELTHVWQLKHLPEIAEDLAEGHIALVAVQYLKFLKCTSLSTVRTTYYESNDNISGQGYRKLVRALLENPQFNNNPFRYLLQVTGGGSSDDVVPPSPRVIEEGDYGDPYVPEESDRAEDGKVNYFYYGRLTATHQRAYDVILDAIRKHEEMTTVDGCTFDDVDKITDAIAFDHPELFWYRTFSMGGNQVKLFYGATAEECAVLERRIGEVVPKYLEGITDTMSAYDVALRLHAKVISTVDYDTIALNREEQNGGPSIEKIDYLRSICGVFLEGKAVCEGYARAMQYLLQKCGIECAEVAGHTFNENGELGCGHAWNIVKIDGDYYHLDATWDDASDTVQAVKNRDLGFEYFCITTEELCRTRQIDLSPTDVPKCEATRANYFYRNGLVLESYDLNKIKAIAQNAAKNKSKYFSLKCKSLATYEATFEKLCKEGDDCCDALKAAAKHDNQIVTSGYSYSYDQNIWTITVKFRYK